MNNSVNRLYFNSQLNLIKDSEYGAKRSFEDNIAQLSVNPTEVTKSVKDASKEDREFLEQMSGALSQYADPVQFKNQVKDPIEKLFGILTNKASELKSAIDKGLS